VKKEELMEVAFYTQLLVVHLHFVLIYTMNYLMYMNVFSLLNFR